MNGKRCKQCLSLLLMGMLALLLLSGCGTAEKDSGGDLSLIHISEPTRH